jgi:hypothetical protein
LRENFTMPLEMPFVFSKTVTPRAGFLSRRAALVLLPLVLSAPCSAETLRQKWVPGQQLTYETTVSGTLTMLADDESPQPWAGLPTDFRVRGSGAVTMETLSVDEAGIGTLALRNGDGKVRGQGFGQVLEMTVKDGRATVLLNNKPLEGAEVRRGESRRFALRVAPSGRVQSVVSLDGKDDTAIAFDWQNAQTWLLRALPSLWPERDLKEGEQWSVPLLFPLPPAKPGDAAPAPLTGGQMTFTLRGAEEIGGRKTQRVALQGTLNLDAAKAKTLNSATRAAAPPKPETKGPLTTRELADASGKMSGDVWLDVANGQIVRAEVTLQGKMHGKGTIRNKAGRTRPTEEWADFDGTIQLQLRRVSYASEEKK